MNMFSGMFGKKNGPMPNADLQMGDAIGQAAMGSPQAFGQGMPEQGMDKNKLAMMLMMSQRGFGMGSGGYNNGGQMPQIRQSYQPMTGPQQMQWFNPNGMR